MIDLYHHAVLPCMGSETHSTLRPASVMALMRRGRCSRSVSAPMRLMSVMRPGTLSGFSVFTRLTTL